MAVTHSLISLERQLKQVFLPLVRDFNQYCNGFLQADPDAFSPLDGARGDRMSRSGSVAQPQHSRNQSARQAHSCLRLPQNSRFIFRSSSQSRLIAINAQLPSCRRLNISSLAVLPRHVQHSLRRSASAEIDALPQLECNYLEWCGLK